MCMHYLLRRKSYDGFAKQKMLDGLWFIGLSERGLLLLSLAPPHHEFDSLRA